MSALVQISGSELDNNLWTISLTPESVDDYLIQQEILKLIVQPEANKMQGMCRLETGFEKLMPLLRGLLRLGKPASLSLIYDFSKSQVFFTYSQSEVKVVEKFFTKVIGMLKKEIRFKQILEKVIANHRKHQAEQAILQSSLHSAVWD
jgi:hypothetical protein